MFCVPGHEFIKEELKNTEFNYLEKGKKIC